MRINNDHDYTQAYDNSWAWVSIRENPREMCHHQAAGEPGRIRLRRLVGGGYITRSMDELDVDPAPIAVHAVNTLGCDQGNRERQIAFFVTRALGRNWKRGLCFQHLHCYAPEGWHPEDEAPIVRALLQGDENFIQADAYWQQIRDLMSNYGRHSAAISPEIILHSRHETGAEKAIIYWNNRSVGLYRQSGEVFLAAEYQYLLPKLNDYFEGEINIV